MNARPDAQSVAALRPFLMRVAISRLRDDQAAEDVVQEAMAAALDKLQTFKAQSQLRTWVTGILLHKVTDTFRAATREKTMRVMPQQSEVEPPESRVAAADSGRHRHQPALPQDHARCRRRTGALG